MLNSIVSRRLFKNNLTKTYRAFGSFVKFNRDDALNLNGLLTEEEKMIQETARQYSQEKLAPRILEANRHEGFDKSIFEEMGNLGFLGCTINEYGLPGISSVAYGLINKELEAVDTSYRTAISVQSSQALKDHWIPKLATGKTVGAFGLTEPNHGSNPGGMETTAKDKGDHFLVNGSKTWISSSPVADVFVVWAKDDNKDIRGFILDRSMKGIETPVIEGKFSIRASITGMILMDDVKVPKENILDVKGLKGPFS